MGVTVTELYTVSKSGSTQLKVSYTMVNRSSDKKITEGSFALFFEDGSKERQLGFFNGLFPGDSSTRSYTFEWTGTKVPLLIEYDADFFAKAPTSNGKKWNANR